jgi:hypothetical protein
MVARLPTGRVHFSLAMDKPPTPDEITRILREWRSGNKDALDRLVPVVYDELKILASRQLAREWRHNRKLDSRSAPVLKSI